MSPDMEFCGYATWSNGWETKSIHSPDMIWRIVALVVTVAHSCISWSSQLIKISIDLSIDKLIKVIKSDLIDIDCIAQSVEIDDTLFSFIDLSWFLPISSIHIWRNICSSFHQKIKPEFLQKVNLLTIEWQLKVTQRVKHLSLYRLSNIIAYKEIFKKSYLFFKTRFKTFFWWLILARSVGAHFFRI